MKIKIFLVCLMIFVSSLAFSQPDAQKVNDALMFTNHGVGQIDHNTLFVKDRIEKLFPDFLIEVSQDGVEDTTFPIFLVKHNSEVFLTIYPDIETNTKIDRILSESPKSHTQSGMVVGTSYAKLFPAKAEVKEKGKSKVNCLPGMEQDSGKVFCQDLDEPNLWYVLSGPGWEGPDGQVPPKQIIKNWKVVALIWKNQ
jgi:hypothetical protein